MIYIDLLIIFLTLIFCTVPMNLSKLIMKSTTSAVKMRSMRAAVVNARDRPIEVAEVPIPVPGDGEVLVKVFQCGVCHTDLHAIDGDWDAKSKLPLIPGHEGVGIIVKLGRNTETICSLGDRVGIPWISSVCGSCEYCITGWETLCASQKNSGFSIDGCLSEFAIAKATNVIPLPKDIPFGQAAPILCAGVTSYKGLKETETAPGEFVAIIGASGGLGHLAVQYAKAMGMRVIALDVGEEQLTYCRSLGAEFAVNALDVDAVEQVQAISDGGCHGVLCLAPQASAFDAAVHMCRRKGTVVCIALPAGSFPCPIVDVVLKRLTIRGSIVGTRKDMREALDFASRGLVCCDVAFDTIDNISDVLHRLRTGQIKGRVVVKLIEDREDSTEQDILDFA